MCVLTVSLHYTPVLAYTCDFTGKKPNFLTFDELSSYLY
jgi:hypothetical protein